MGVVRDDALGDHARWVAFIAPYGALCATLVSHGFQKLRHAGVVYALVACGADAAVLERVVRATGVCVLRIGAASVLEEVRDRGVRGGGEERSGGGGVAGQRAGVYARVGGVRARRVGESRE